MSSRTDSFHCGLRRSRLLRGAQAVSALLAVVAVWMSGMALPWQLPLILLVLGYGWHLWRRTEPFTALRHDGDGWQVCDLAGQWYPVVPCADTVITPWLIVLRVRVEGRKRIHSQCIPRDALADDVHRRLRVRLRFSRRVQGVSMVSLASSRSSG